MARKKGMIRDHNYRCVHGRLETSIKIQRVKRIGKRRPDIAGVPNLQKQRRTICRQMQLVQIACRRLGQPNQQFHLQ